MGEGEWDEFKDMKIEHKEGGYTDDNWDVWDEGKEGDPNWGRYKPTIKKVCPTKGKYGNCEFFGALNNPPEYKDFIDLINFFDLDKAEHGFNMIKHLWTKYGALTFHTLEEAGLVNIRKCEKTGLYVPLTTYRENDTEYFVIFNFGQLKPMDGFKH